MSLLKRTHPESLTSLRHLQKDIELNKEPLSKLIHETKVRIPWFKLKNYDNKVKNERSVALLRDDSLMSAYQDKPFVSKANVKLMPISISIVKNKTGVASSLTSSMDEPLRARLAS